MRIVRTVKAMQAWRRQLSGPKARIGLVPTMGCLHPGHLSLVDHARQLVGPRGTVVVSIYVNPTQFGPGEDFAKYPRVFQQDARLCRAAKADVLFAPSDQEMYPAEQDQAFSTYVTEEALSRSMEGVSRPTHFRGVTTVVAKLFNIVQPDVAVFGEKDFQQAAIIRRMVRDLNFPLKVIVAPTVRETDGLAMSSRNRFLKPAERGQALVLWQAIQWARQRVKSTKGGIPAKELEAELAQLFQEKPLLLLDYISFFDPVRLTPVEKVRRGTHLALAVFVGRTRLIDNGRL